MRKISNASGVQPKGELLVKRALIVFVSIVALFLAPGTIQAADSADGVLGIPWGSSPTQVRQLMEQNGFSYVREIRDPQLLMATGALNGTYIVSFNQGIYAGYRVEDVYVESLKNQMVRLRVHIWAENVGSENLLNNAFDDLKKLLSEKYGAPTDDSRNIVLGNKSARIDTFYWKLDGDKSIRLSKTPSFGTTTTNFSARIDVEYKNMGLYQELKNSSRQNI